MNRTDIVAEVAKKLNTPKSIVKAVVDATFELMASELASGEKVAISNFGSFVVKTAAARIGRNPATGEELDIEEKKRLKFIPASDLKAAIQE